MGPCFKTKCLLFVWDPQQAGCGLNSFIQNTSMEPVLAPECSLSLNYFYCL